MFIYSCDVFSENVGSPQGRELSSLESSGIEPSSANLPVLSNEDTLVSELAESTIPSSSVGINGDLSSKTPILQSDQLIYSCTYCGKTAVGKEELATHRDKVSSCPHCDYESTEHIKLHLCEPSSYYQQAENLKSSSKKEQPCKIVPLKPGENSLEKVRVADVHVEQNEQSCKIVPVKPGENSLEKVKVADVHVEQNEQSCKIVPVKPEENSLEIVSVADVHVQQNEQPEKEAKLHRNSKVRMKISKDFDKIESRLKEKIFGMLKSMIETSENPSETCRYYRIKELSDDSVSLEKWSCQKCEHVSLSWGEHVQHLLTHPTQTYHCNSVLRSRSHLSGHSQARQYICEFCGECFCSKQHVLMHCADGEVFECRTCDSRRHRRGDAATSLCDRCGKIVRNLKNHQLCHVNPQFFKRHQCIECSKICQTR